jgi:hypothetical protein
VGVELEERQLNGKKKYCMSEGKKQGIVEEHKR